MGDKARQRIHTCKQCGGKKNIAFARLHGLSECSCLREEKRRERRKIQKKENSRRKRATIKGDWLQIDKKCDPEAWVLYADLLDQTPANAVYTDELYRRHDRGDIIEKIVFGMARRCQYRKVRVVTTCPTT